MPLFPYVPLIVWMGMIQVVLGAPHNRDAQSVDDLADLAMKCGNIIPLPRVLPAA